MTKIRKSEPLLPAIDSAASRGRIGDRLGISHDQMTSFCQRWMIAEMALFGSILRDDFGRESDVDVLIDFNSDAGWSLFDISRMRLELSSLLGREADVVQLSGLRNPFRRRAILSSREIIYAA